VKGSYSKIVNLFNSLNPDLSLKASNISSFKKRMNENNSIVNSFFANFDSLYYDLDDTNLSSILRKIKAFPKDIVDFNSTFFKIMPRHFFSKV